MECRIISFLGIHQFEDGRATRGGILITDKTTKPLEFRVTSPVRPEKFQKVLYGEILDEHIAVTLIGLPLLESVQQKPDLIIVRDSLLLGINTYQEIPSILMLAEKEDTALSIFMKYT